MMVSGRTSFHGAAAEDDADADRDRDGEALPEPDRCRLRALVDEHLDFIWRSLRRLGVPEASVDDAAQNVFCVALRRIDDIEPGRERAFLFTTAMYVAADTRRGLARARERVDDQAIDAAVDSDPTPDQVVDRKQARALLDEVLGAMEDDLRTVFVLFEMEDLSSPEIASLLGIPLGTVASRLRRSREQFHAIAKRVRARALRAGGAG
jgi:RNA polymerase sigma-70 factor (ECF subfamily)